MTTRFKMPTAALYAVFTLVACEMPSDFDQEDADELAATATQDVDDLLRTAETQAAAAATLDEALEEGEICWNAVGDCEGCATYEGALLSGTFEAGMVETPCGATWTIGRRIRTYTVESGGIEGSWTRQDDGTYVVELSGGRDVSFEASGGATQRRDHDVDASWTLHALTVTVDGNELVDYALDLEYLGFAGHVSRLELAGTPAAGGGTLTVDGGQVCDVVRTGDEVVVDCSGAVPAE